MKKQSLLSFPNFGDRNIKLYYFLTILLNGWFILPNWVFYFGAYISIAQIGIIDGLSKLVAVVLEVPSGALSDLLGKRNILILGNGFIAACCLMIINATSFNTLLIGNILMFIGFALISGAKEALLYDSLIDIKKEGQYDDVLGKVNSVAMFTTIVSIFAGGLLFRIDPRLTFITWMAFAILAIIALFFMKEPYADEGSLSYSLYFSKLKTGVASIFNKPFFSFVLPVLLFSMLIKSYEGVIRQNTGAYFGFNGETFGYLMALISIPSLVVSYNYKKIVAKFKENIEYLFTLLYILGFIVVYLTNNLYLGVFSFLSVYVAQEMLKPYILGLVNKNTESKHRATTISTVSLFSEIPYMIIVIFFGSILELDKIKYLYLGFVLVLSAYLLKSFLIPRSDKVSIPDNGAVDGDGLVSPREV